MTKYSDTSVILSIFTEVFGIQSYMVNGVRSARQNKMALFQPLTLLDMVVYHHENKTLQRIKEVKCLHQYQSVSADLRKSTVMMFLHEVLVKSLKENSDAPELYRQIAADLIMLDTGAVVLENFPILFLLRLGKTLGFGISDADDLIAGRYFPDAFRSLINAIMEVEYTEAFPISRQDRTELLNLLLEVYQQHLGTSEYRSLPVLREILGSA